MLDTDSINETFDALEEPAESRVVSYILEKLEYAKTKRSASEQKWQASFEQWRGIHSQDELPQLLAAQERNPQTIPIFIKITKQKVTAAQAQIEEILFNEDKLPIEVVSTPIPEGVEETIHITTEQAISATNQSPYGYEGDGKELAPGTSTKDLLGAFSDTIGKLLGNKTVAKGPSPDRSQAPELHPADEAAMHMTKLIQDQLAETNAIHAFKMSILECVMLGTTVLKGPVTWNRIIDKWVQDPLTGKIEYTPQKELSPKLNWCSLWNIYPDPDATSSEDIDWVIERHLLSSHNLKQLSKLPFINKEVLVEILNTTPMYAAESWESVIQDSDMASSRRRYELFEYWGDISVELAVLLGLIEDTEDTNALDTVAVTALVCDGKLLRLVLNPFVPYRLPYHFIPFENHPNQLYGISLPENIVDTQTLMNIHVRMAVENLRLSGSLCFEVNRDLMEAGQTYEISPGKIFYRTNGAPGQAIVPINFTNTTQQHLMMFDKMRQLCDEASNMPSYSHGGVSTTGASRTASGISMLMGAAALTIKSVIRNYDHYGLKPIGEDYFAWNMQFNEKNSKIRGDLKIVAKGTSSLMQKEVRSQRLMGLLQMTANPMLAPFFNLEYLIKEQVKSLDLDPEKAVNDTTKARLYADILRGLNGQDSGTGTQVSNQQQTAGGNTPPASTPEGNTGNGNGTIGTGVVPRPGEASFSQ